MLQVSHTTVSRSLNDSPLISRETKAKVKEIARRYNYVPNVSARSLVLSKSYNIGLFFSTLQSGTTASFFLDAVRGISAVVKSKYKLAVEAIGNFKDFQSVNARNFDGIILMSQTPEDDLFIAHVLKERIPLVVLNREIPAQKVTTILTDDLAGAYAATSYLIEMGHRRIAMIQGKPDFRTTQKRLKGFKEALKTHQIDLSEDYLIQGNFDIQSGYEAMQRLLLLKDWPTAVFCSNDDMAIGAMKAIQEHGLLIPRDVSLVGYDDNGISGYLSPALTTVKRPIEELSFRGAGILLEILEGDLKQEGKIINLPTELEVRESVARLSN